MDFLSSWLGKDKEQSKTEESGRFQKLPSSQKNVSERRTKNINEKTESEKNKEPENNKPHILHYSATMEILTEVVTCETTATSTNDTSRKVSWSDDWSESDESDSEDTPTETTTEITTLPPAPFFIPFPPPPPSPYSFPVKKLTKKESLTPDPLDDMEKGNSSVRERGDFAIDFSSFDFSQLQTADLLFTEQPVTVQPVTEQPVIYQSDNLSWRVNPFHNQAGNDEREEESSEEYIIPPVRKRFANREHTESELPICNDELKTDPAPEKDTFLGDFANIRFDELNNHWASLKEPLLPVNDGEVNFPEEIYFPREFNFPEEVRTCEEYGQLINSMNDPWILPQGVQIHDDNQQNLSEESDNDQSDSSDSVNTIELSESDYSENYDWNRQTEGSLELYIGPMFSGKSTAIIFKLARMADIGFDTLYINHADDNRETEAQDNAVSTHNSQYSKLSKKINSMKVSELSNINVRDYEYIAIDEGQFFPDLYKCVITWVTAYGKNVLVASLDGDAFRRKFGQVLDLVPQADKVKKLTAICNVCLTNEKKARPAPFTARFSKGTDAKVVGGTDKYKAVCRSCHDRHLDTVTI